MVNTNFALYRHISTLKYCIIILGILKEGEQMINNKFFLNDRGFTLLEVLLSITLLGILLISLLSFFNQAYSYTKKNEDKTIGINVARNVLHYIEQQDFDLIKSKFLSGITSSEDKVVVTVEDCLHFDEDVCKSFLSSTINNTNFHSTIELKLPSNQNLEDYLIEVIVHVNWGNQTTSVRGHIKK